MPRPSWKIPFVSSSIIMDTAEKQRIIDLIHKQDPSELGEYPQLDNKSGNPKYVVISRSSTIPRSLLGSYVQVYNGIKYLSFKIVVDQIGKKFGEFAHSRKILMHKEGKKKQLQKK